MDSSEATGPPEVSQRDDASSPYVIPTKHILSTAHLKAFRESSTREDIIAFVDTLSSDVKGKKLSETGESSPSIVAILSLLTAIESIALTTPPVPNEQSRFGNPAFQTFYDKLESSAVKLHETYLGDGEGSQLRELLRAEGTKSGKGKDKERDTLQAQEESHSPADSIAIASTSSSTHTPGTLPIPAIPEVSAYLTNSFGNRQRIDYGSGMELNFLCWLMCLQKVGVLHVRRGVSGTGVELIEDGGGGDDGRALVLSVFWRYIQIMRLLQQTYWLEPAGSHGVWGLDDYHFLPFLFGASQLDGHRHLRPKCIHDPEIMEAFKGEYMYLACVDFINGIKTASLRWHSPMLDDISAVKTWSKVSSGMTKMYHAEVLNKLPVVQHFLFGSLLPFPAGAVSEEDEQDAAGQMDEHGHVHPKKGEGWTMDCCGIPVPSAFGAAAAAAATVEESSGRVSATTGLLKSRGGLKPIPFD